MSGRGGLLGGVVLFGARGERLRPTPLEVPEGGVRSVAFGPGGTLAAGYARRRQTTEAAAWCSSTRRASGSGRRRWRSPRAGSPAWPSARAAPSPRDTVASAAACIRGGVVLFGDRGERLRPTPLEVTKGGVASVAFGPGGTLAAGYVGGDGGGGVVLFGCDLRLSSR